MTKFWVHAAKDFWNWLVEDIPALLVALYTWILGRTWIEFGLRLSLAGMFCFLVHSLWLRAADSGDRNPLITLGILAAIMIVVMLSVAAYTSGLWRDFRLAW